VRRAAVSARAPTARARSSIIVVAEGSEGGTARRSDGVRCSSRLALCCSGQGEL
jgi:hypothetical protein